MSEDIVLRYFAVQQTMDAQTHVFFYEMPSEVNGLESPIKTVKSNPRGIVVKIYRGTPSPTINYRKALEDQILLDIENSPSLTEKVTRLFVDKHWTLI